MKNPVKVTPVSLAEAVRINGTIPEFKNPGPYPVSYFTDRIGQAKHLVIAGFVGNQPAGYMVSYDRDQDGSFYCWMAGVDPTFRRHGVLTALMEYLETWAASNKYSQLKITTRNNRREMLSFLVGRGFLFTSIVPYPDPTDNRIALELPL